MAELPPGEARSLLEALFHSHSGVKLLIDPADGRLVDAAASAVEFYGYPREQLLAMRIGDLNTLPPEAVEQELKRADARAQSFFQFQHRLASGEVREVAVNSSPVDLDGRRLLFSIVHDVTERVRVERELRSAQAYQRALFDGALDAIVVASTDGVITDVNAQAELLFGRPREALVGQPHQVLYPADQQAAARARLREKAAGRSVEPQVVELEIERPGGGAGCPSSWPGAASAWATTAT